MLYRCILAIVLLFPSAQSSAQRHGAGKLHRFVTREVICADSQNAPLSRLYEQEGVYTTLWVALQATVKDKKILPYSDKYLTGQPVDSANIAKFVSIPAVDKYLLCEEWIFNERIGKIDVRIISVAPCYTAIPGDTTANPICWFSHQLLRPLLNEYKMKAGANGEQLTCMDFIDGRLFKSRIVNATEFERL